MGAAVDEPVLLLAVLDDLSELPDEPLDALSELLDEPESPELDAALDELLSEPDALDEVELADLPPRESVL